MSVTDAAHELGAALDAHEAAHMLQLRVPSTTFLVVGDSMAHRFDGLFIDHPVRPATVKARWQPMSSTSDLMRDGQFSEYFTRILMEMRWVKRTTETHWPFPMATESLAGTGPAFNLKPRAAVRCVVLFSFGDSDIFTLAHDYASWGPGEAARAVGARCEPLFTAIRTMKEVGYRNVFLHDLSPVAKFAPPTWPPYRARMEIIAIARALFRDFAASADVDLISTWDEMYSEEEGRRPEFVRDHAHLNQASAAFSVQYLCEALEQRGYFD